MGQKIVRETRHFDADTRSTHTLRKKETEEDYGYIFEPDLTSSANDDIGETDEIPIHPVDHERGEPALVHARRTNSRFWRRQLRRPEAGDGGAQAARDRSPEAAREA